MLNQKLVGVYKEFPWLVALSDKIGNPSVVKVTRLDSAALNCRCGIVIMGDEGYFVQGYFHTSSGELIQIHPQHEGFLGALKCVFCATDVNHCATTIEEAARDLPLCDTVTEVVLFGDDFHSDGKSQLCLYKMPRGRTLGALLEEFEYLRNEMNK